MSRFFPVLLMALAGLPLHAAAPPRPVARQGKPADVYVQDKVWEIHISVGAKEFEKMAPTRGGMFGIPGMGLGKQQPAPLTEDRKIRGGFGYDFEYVKGDMVIDGAGFKNVAVRFKGSGSYALSAQAAKKPFRIDLDRYVEGQNFKGVKKFTLGNHALDPTSVRESLSYAVYRAAGVPAPRTTYARVTFSVPGKYDRELLGLYSLVETIDKPYLKDRFGSSKGLLVKPERVGPMEYLGEDWKPYDEKYRPKTDATKKDQQRLIDFARLVQKDDDATFKKRIDSFLDVDKFMRFLAATVLLSTMDSFIGLNHNWELYLNPKTNKFVFLPWDLDLSFGAFTFSGSAQALMDLSIRQPYQGQNKLIERLLKDEKVYAAYQGHLKALLKKGFTAEGIKADLDRLNKFVLPLKKEEERAASARRERAGGFGGPGGGMFGQQPPSIDSFVVKRIESVEAQLAGKSKGTTPGGGFGIGGPGPGGRGPAAALVRPVLDAADKDKDRRLSKNEVAAAIDGLYKTCEADKNGEVNQSSLTKALEKIMPRPQGFGNPPSQAPGWAKSIIDKAGKDGKLTRAGLVAEAEKRFTAADRNRDGKLDEQELGQALNELAPPPPPRPNFAAPFLQPALEGADTDKDGKLTKAEAVAGVKALFKACTADKKGAVDRASLTKALDTLLPKPPQFGGFALPSQAPVLARRIIERAGKAGKLTEAGIVAEAERLFAACDKNKDGKLDEPELTEALRDYHGPQMFGGPGGFNAAMPIVRPALEVADTDIDGRLTRKEVTVGLEALFKTCEADKDGAVRLDALQKALEKVLPKQQTIGPFTPPSQAPGLAKSIIEKAGKDGKVTKAALLTEAEKRFTAADKDKDDKLDEAELAEALRELVPAPRFGQ